MDRDTDIWIRLKIEDINEVIKVEYGNKLYHVKELQSNDEASWESVIPDSTSKHARCILLYIKFEITIEIPTS